MLFSSISVDMNEVIKKSAVQEDAIRLVLRLVSTKRISDTKDMGIR